MNRSLFHSNRRLYKYLISTLILFFSIHTFSMENSRLSCSPALENSRDDDQSERLNDQKLSSSGNGKAHISFSDSRFKQAPKILLPSVLQNERFGPGTKLILLFDSDPQKSFSLLSIVDSTLSKTSQRKPISDKKLKRITWIHNDLSASAPLIFSAPLGASQQCKSGEVYVYPHINGHDVLVVRPYGDEVFASHFIQLVSSRLNLPSRNILLMGFHKNAHDPSKLLPLAENQLSSNNANKMTQELRLRLVNQLIQEILEVTRKSPLFAGAPRKHLRELTVMAHRMTQLAFEISNPTIEGKFYSIFEQFVAEKISSFAHARLSLNPIYREIQDRAILNSRRRAPLIAQIEGKDALKFGSPEYKRASIEISELTMEWQGIKAELSRYKKSTDDEIFRLHKIVKHLVKDRLRFFTYQISYETHIETLTSTGADELTKTFSSWISPP